jgi:ribose-phosphate pyrophosphokinase
MMAATVSVSLKLISGNAHPALAGQVARELSVAPEPVEIEAFADGEMRVQVPPDVRGAAVVIVQPTSPPVHDHLMTLALLIDACRAAGAARVVGVVPYFGYARQERRGCVGEPRSAQVVARLLEAVGLDHLVTLDLHAPALESAFRMPATVLEAEEAFLPRIEAWGIDAPVVVAPDAGALKRAQRYATALGGGLAVVAKERPRPDATATLHVLGEVRDRTCLIVDDLVSTGRTLTGAAEALRTAGAGEIHAVFSHAVMAPEAFERLLAAPLGRLLTSDSVPAPEHPRLEVAPIAPLLARVCVSIVGTG